MAALTAVKVTDPSTFGLVPAKEVATQDLQVLGEGAVTILTAAEQRAQSVRAKTLAVHDQSAAESAAHIAALTSSNEALQRQIVVLEGKESESSMIYAARIATLEAELATLRAQKEEMSRTQAEAATREELEKEKMRTDHQNAMDALTAATTANVEAARKETEAAREQTKVARKEAETFKDQAKANGRQMEINKYRYDRAKERFKEDVMERIQRLINFHVTRGNSTIPLNDLRAIQGTLEHFEEQYLKYVL